MAKQTEEQETRIIFNEDTKCSNGVTACKDVEAILIKTDGKTTVFRCGELIISCPADSYDILD